MAQVIKSFSGEYRFLSNFYDGIAIPDMDYRSLVYSSVEAAYQAAKTLDRSERKKFVLLPPGEAKKKGRTIKLRSDWEAVKIGVMTHYVRKKFELDTDLRDSLCATGNAQLVEGNTWHDEFWGVDNLTGAGQNWLGIILMIVRSEVTMQRATEYE